MGSFVVRSTTPGGEDRVQGADASRGAIGRSIETAVGVLWRVLSSKWGLIVPAALVGLWVIVVAAIPGFRPGFAGLSETTAGQVVYAWDLLHPASRLALRGLFVLLMMVLLTRLAQGLFPSIEGLPSGEPFSLSVGAPSTVATATDVWDRLFMALGGEDTSRKGSRATPAASQALLYPAAWQRVCSQLPVVGAILALTGALLLCIGARGVISPPVLAGDAADLPDLVSAATLRLQTESVFLREQDSSVGVQLSWSLPGEEASSPLLLVTDRWRPYRGAWLRVVDAPPALSLTVRDAAYEPLPLVPVIGDRQSLAMFRGVVPQEEQMLTVPDAGIVVRVARTLSGSGSEDVVVEALDGGLGTLLGRAVPLPEAVLELPGAIVLAHRELAAVVSIWRLPGLALFSGGVLIGLAGMLLRRRCSPWRAWIGVQAIDGSDGWQVLVASEPPDVAARICERITGEQSETACCDRH